MAFSSLKRTVHQSVWPQVEPRRKSQHWVPVLLRFFLEEVPECVWRNEISSAIWDCSTISRIFLLSCLKSYKRSHCCRFADRWAFFFFWIARIRKILFKLLRGVQLRAAESEKSEFLFPCKMQTQRSVWLQLLQRIRPHCYQVYRQEAPGWTPEKHQISQKAGWCCESVCVCVCSCAFNPFSCLLSPCCLARLQSCTLVFWAMQWWTGAAWVPERNGLTQPNTRESRVRLDSPR